MHVSFARVKKAVLYTACFSFSIGAMVMATTTTTTAETTAAKTVVRAVSAPEYVPANAADSALFVPTVMVSDEEIPAAAPVFTVYLTSDSVNLRAKPSADSDKVVLLAKGTAVKTAEYIAGGWTKVKYENTEGFIKSEYLLTEEEYAALPFNNIELLTWAEARNVFTIGVNAEVYDVRTGLTYYVRSFSNGNHADVEPVTEQDTATMKKTYGGQWSWDPRPVFVTINGHTMAASINGMPHGGGVNSGNGMSGQVCIHFKNSTTHNGNRSHERDHQAAINEAWSAR